MRRPLSALWESAVGAEGGAEGVLHVEKFEVVWVARDGGYIEAHVEVNTMGAEIYVGRTHHIADFAGVDCVFRATSFLAARLYLHEYDISPFRRNDVDFKMVHTPVVFHNGIPFFHQVGDYLFLSPFTESIVFSHNCMQMSRSCRGVGRERGVIYIRPSS